MIIYTDGSFSKKVTMDAAGYSCIVITGEDKESYTADIIYGRIEDPLYTAMWNVGGEIWAAMVAVNYALESSPTEIDLYYDYSGVEHWATRRWQAKNPITKAYGRKMREFGQKVPIHYHQVRGHTGVQLNELADTYAKMGLHRPDDKPCYIKDQKIEKGR